MSQLSQKIKIVASPELTEMKMEAFIGYLGIISEDLTGDGRQTKGYNVTLLGTSPIDDDECDLWFIPETSVKTLKE